MTKLELLRKLSEKTGLKQKEAEAFLSAFVETVTEEVSEGGEVNIIGFGKFATSSRGERIGRNPQTGEAITIPAHKVPVFKAGKAFKASVK